MLIMLTFTDTLPKIKKRFEDLKRFDDFSGEIDDRKEQEEIRIFSKQNSVSQRALRSAFVSHFVPLPSQLSWLSSGRTGSVLHGNLTLQESPIKYR
jgi:hypothetical protein